jgi:hypothetical protein
MLPHVSADGECKAVRDLIRITAGKEACVAAGEAQTTLVATAMMGSGVALDFTGDRNAGGRRLSCCTAAVSSTDAPGRVASK